MILIGGHGKPIARALAYGRPARMWWAKPAVDEVVLAAMGLVGDDDDVAPVRKHGVAVARLGGHELLDGREDDTTAADADLLAKVGGLDGILALPATHDSRVGDRAR